VPWILKPTWKPDGDKLGLVVPYAANPACTLTAPIVLRNVVLVATYSGGRAVRVQTKPAGTHLADKQLVYWRLGDVTLDGTERRIVGRVFGEPGAVLRPGTVDVRWEHVGSESGAALISGVTISREELGGHETADDKDPFADEENQPHSEAGKTWADVPLARKLVSGRYEAREQGLDVGHAPSTPGRVDSPSSPRSV